MFLLDKWLDIAFRLTLFVLFSYQAYTLLSNYVLPYLRQRLKIFYDEQAALLNQEGLFRSTLKKIENDTYLQKRKLAILEKRVEEWYDALKADYLQQEHENKNIAIRLQEKRRRQQEITTRIAIAEQAIPEAITLVKQELLVRQKNEKSYINSVIEKM